MADSSLFDGNPYYSPPQPTGWQSGLNSLGVMLSGLGGGLAANSGTGQPWTAGIGMGAQMATQQLAREREYDQTRAWHALQMGQLAEYRRDQIRLRDEALKDKEQAAADKRTAATGFNLPGTPGVQMGPGAPPPPTAPPANLQTVGQPIMNYLQTAGNLSPVAAAGVAGNLYHESGFNTGASGDQGAATGIAQWRDDRRTGLENYAKAQGKPVTDMQTQLDYLLQEMKSGDMGAQRAYAELQRAQTPEQAATAMLHFERPQGYTPANPQGSLGYQNRVANAQALAGAQPPQAPAPVQTQSALPPQMMAGGPLPPFQGPGMSTPGQALPQPLAMAPQQPPTMMAQGPQPNVVQGGDNGSPTPVQFTPPAAGPAPQMAPAPMPPQVPRPQLDPDTAARITQQVRSGAITPQQGYAEAEKLTNEQWTRDQTRATQAWQAQMDDRRAQRSEANKADVWTRLDPTEAQQKYGLPPNVQYLQNKNGDVKPIGGSKSPMDVSDQFRGPEIDKLVAAMPPATRAAYNAAVQLGHEKEAAGYLTAQQNKIPEDAPTGPAYVKTLPREEQNLVQSLIDGRMTPTQLSKRNVDYNSILAKAVQADPSYTPNDAGARQAFETKYMETGQGGQTKVAANTALMHLGNWRDAMAALNNHDPILLNKVLNEARKQFGDANVPSAEVAANLYGTEIAKAIRGGGTLNESEEKLAKQMVDTSLGPKAADAVASQLTSMMQGRMHVLQDIGQMHGITKEKTDSYMTPAALASLDYVKNNPIAGAKATSSMQPKSGDPLEGRTISAPGKPTLIRRDGKWVPQ